ATGPSVGWCFPQIKGLKATKHSVVQGRVVLPTDEGPKGNRAQRRVVLPTDQGPKGNRAQRRVVLPTDQGPKGSSLV
ncbi:hypothetical protein PR001_g30601, partial [Phytophthora rubi]